MERRVHEEVKFDQVFPPESRSTANTLYNNAAIGSAVGIDCKGYEDASIVINNGVIGATTITYDIGFADVDDAEDASFAILSGTTKAVVNADDGKEFVISVRCKDNGRYMFVKRVQADAVACLDQVAVALGRPQNSPVTQNQTAVVPADVS